MLKGFGASRMSRKDSVPDEDPTAAAGDLTIYKYYIQTFGWTRWTIFCFFCALYGFGTAFPSNSFSTSLNPTFLIAMQMSG
jgi:hypothetical protein